MKIVALELQLSSGVTYYSDIRKCTSHSLPRKETWWDGAENEFEQNQLSEAINKVKNVQILMKFNMEFS